MISIYNFPLSFNHVSVKHDRRQMFPLLKPFIKRTRFSDEERVNIYNVSEVDFDFVDQILEADILVFPWSWNFYTKNGTSKLIENFVRKYEALDKPILIVMMGDFGFPIPLFKNFYVLRQSGMKSKLPSSHFGMPVFIEDPLKRVYQHQTINLRPYHQVPSVGFCGQASGNRMTAVREVFRTFIKKSLHYLKLYKPTPQPIQSTSFNRFRHLKRLMESSEIETHFIIREKHGGGLDFGREGSAMEKEFFDNIVDSDYVVCYRGAGNFSVRFYETLAMGRIPIFINTDCLLPLEHEIEWKRHVVWIEELESNQIVDKVLAFHKKLDSKSFEALQRDNRKLWENKLQLGGYFKTLLPFLKA